MLKVTPLKVRFWPAQIFLAPPALIPCRRACPTLHLDPIDFLLLYLLHRSVIRREYRPESFGARTAFIPYYYLVVQLN